MFKFIGFVVVCCGCYYAGANHVTVRDAVKTGSSLETQASGVVDQVKKAAR